MEIRASTPGDFEAVFELLTACSIAAFGESELQRDHVELAWQLASTDRFVAIDGVVVGYAALDGAHDTVLAARENDACDALLETIERRARERGFDTLTATVVPQDAQFHALVRRAGFEHRGDVLRMWRRLDNGPAAPDWPDDVSVRTYTVDDAPRVQALLDEAYAAWDETYVARRHDDWVQWMTAHDEFDPALWFLVERGDELVACVLHWKEHEGKGWVKDLVVRESERGRGLGTLLLHTGFAEYARRGVERVGLKVDSENPTGAPQLYERVGFVTDRRYGIWVKPL